MMENKKKDERADFGKVNVVFKNFKGRTLIKKVTQIPPKNTQGTIQRQHLLEEMQ